MSKTFNNSISMIDEDGEGVTITPIDPNLPCGKLEGQTANDVANDWLEQNYPNFSENQLYNMGITVEFEVGDETFELYNDDGTTRFVSEEEYNKQVEGLNVGPAQVISNFLTVEGNDSKIDSLVVSTGGLVEHIGTSHKEPGKIKIHIDNNQMSSYMSGLMDTKLTTKQANKINHVLEKLTGVKNDVSSGMSIKGAYDDILETLKDKDISAKKIRVSGIILTVVLKPTMDVLELENLFDADEGGFPQLLNDMAKTGNWVILLVGMTELASGGTASGILLTAGLICTAIDVLIRDDDEVNIFKLNKNGEIEYDFFLKNTDGVKIHYTGEIKLNYDDPQVLINQIYVYLETAKLQLCAELDTLRNKRIDIIERVKMDIEDDMYSIAYDMCVGRSTIDSSDDKSIQSLCEIYDTDYVRFINPLISKSPYNEYMNDKYALVSISYNGLHFSYTISFVSKDNRTSSLDSLVYDGDLYALKSVVLSICPTDEEINEHCKMYIKSYYQSILASNATRKDD
ncbi:MAG: hypothetical protein ACK5G7_04795, partial [Erysipelotrichaceae bacterium]